jgi:hypothetical protein
MNSTEVEVHVVYRFRGTASIQEVVGSILPGSGHFFLLLNFFFLLLLLPLLSSSSPFFFLSFLSFLLQLELESFFRRLGRQLELESFVGRQLKLESFVRWLFGGS